MPNKVANAATAIVTIALACFVALTLMTFVAIERSRDRTSCYRTAQVAEECPAISWWENILRRTIGPST